jgi:hypothetical protein
MLQLIKKHGAEGAFPPDEVAMLVEAFEEAWADVLKSGAQLGSERRIEDARMALSRYIIDEALQGERDKRPLRDNALLHYTRSRLWDNPTK